MDAKVYYPTTTRGVDIYLPTTVQGCRSCVCLVWVPRAAVGDPGEQPSQYREAHQPNIKLLTRTPLDRTCLVFAAIEPGA